MKNDTISRQAAIDALTEHAEWMQERYHETCSLPGMIRVIEELPSAEPEPCGEDGELDFVQEHKKLLIILKVVRNE